MYKPTTPRLISFASYPELGNDYKITGKTLHIEKVKCNNKHSFDIWNIFDRQQIKEISFTNVLFDEDFLSFIPSGYQLEKVVFRNCYLSQGIGDFTVNASVIELANCFSPPTAIISPFDGKVKDLNIYNSQLGMISIQGGN